MCIFGFFDDSNLYRYAFVRKQGNCVHAQAKSLIPVIYTLLLTQIMLEYNTYIFSTLCSVLPMQTKYHVLLKYYIEFQINIHIKTQFTNLQRI